VDSAVPVIDKMWGINTFYSMLKGRRGYRRNHPSLDQNRINWPHFAAWYASLANQDVGIPIGTTLAAGREKVLWLTRTDELKYGIQDTMSMQAATNSDRYEVNGAGLFRPKTDVTYLRTITPPIGLSRVWCALNTVGNASAWTFDQSVRGAMSLQSQPQSFTSLILIMRMQAAIDPTYRSLVIKPVGIDRIGLSWFDAAKYELFVQYSSREQSTKIKVLSTIGYSDQTADLVWIDKVDWCPFETGGSARLGDTKTAGSMPTVRFFLRDRVSNAISSASSMCARLYAGETDAPGKWLIDRN
jgi:hypothetical protein